MRKLPEGQITSPVTFGLTGASEYGRKVTWGMVVKQIFATKPEVLTSNRPKQQRAPAVQA